MTVKELIDKLKTLDEDKEITYYDNEYGNLETINGITMDCNIYVIE